MAPAEQLTLEAAPETMHMAEQEAKTSRELKRSDRTESFDALLAQEAAANAPSQGLKPFPGEAMSSFFKRLASKLDRAVFKVVPASTLASPGAQDGLYLAKRPVRGPANAGMLSECGSVLHHVILYLKEGAKLVMLDHAPAGGADTSANLLEPAPSRAVLREGAALELPDPHGLSLLYLGATTHTLGSAALASATAFIEWGPYHALRRNCIHAADFLARVLTGGRAAGAPLAFDALCGRVPEVDPPMLAMLPLLTGGMAWHDVLDGSALLAQFSAHAGASSRSGASTAPQPAAAASLPPTKAAHTATGAGPHPLLSAIASAAAAASDASSASAVAAPAAAPAAQAQRAGRDGSGTAATAGSAAPAAPPSTDAADGTGTAAAAAPTATAGAAAAARAASSGVGALRHVASTVSVSSALPQARGMGLGLGAGLASSKPRRSSSAARGGDTAAALAAGRASDQAGGSASGGHGDSADGASTDTRA